MIRSYLKNTVLAARKNFWLNYTAVYLPLVYGVALKYLKNVPDAQDVVMQIWEELFEKILKYEIQVFKSWLYTCVRNYCLMELRKRTGNFSLQLVKHLWNFVMILILYMKKKLKLGNRLWRSVWRHCPRTNGCVSGIFIWRNVLIGR